MTPYRIYTVPAYYLTVVMFGVCGFALSMFGLLAGAWPASPRVERFFQRLIHSHFRFFLWWGEVSRLFLVRFHGFPRETRGALVVAANHPSLVDITCLLAKAPEAVCIFKPAIRRNPVLGAAARRAGYIASDGGHDSLREAAAVVARGNTLIVFPEGTRTPVGETLLPLKAGFVLIARRAGVPIRLVRIVSDTNVLAKGRAKWKPPRLPVCVDLTFGPLVSTDNALTPAELAARIEEWFRHPSPAPCHPALAGLTLPRTPDHAP